jgi:hypothetical protein
MSQIRFQIPLTASLTRSIITEAPHHNLISLHRRLVEALPVQMQGTSADIDRHRKGTAMGGYQVHSSTLVRLFKQQKGNAA